MPAPKRVDSTHREIAQSLRQIGAVVLDVHSVPGCLDLLVAFRGALHLLEVKTPNSWRGKQITPAEQETIRLLASVGVEAKVVRTVEEAWRAIGAIL